MNHHPRPPHPSRRAFLKSAAAVSGAMLLGGLPSFVRAADAAAEDVSFFLLSDTHYLADAADPSKLDPRSADATSRLVDAVNALPGTAIPDAAGGGSVAAKPRGVIHAGDLIDTGDKTGSTQTAMQKTEFAAFERDFGLTGTDGRLKFPVFELHGNHDAPGGKGLALDGIVRRNKARPGLANTSPNGLHYSWDWGPVHFVNLGIVVGEAASGPNQHKRRYDPRESLAFLVEDLKDRVTDKTKHVVITHHVDVARYSVPCDPAAPADNKEWDPCDCHKYYDAIKSHPRVTVLYGHTHARNVFPWTGTPPAKAPAAANDLAGPGVRVINTEECAHFKSEAHALFYLTISPTTGALTAREYATTDNWRTGAWTPRTWSWG
jgi:cytolysin (calcineurin-like family phosphatase)